MLHLKDREKMRSPVDFRAAIHAMILLPIIAIVMTDATVRAAGPLIIDADSQFRYAQSRLDAGAHDEAVYEFNRFIHFFPDDARVPTARYRIGMAHFAAGRFDAAVSAFSALAADATPSPLAGEAFLMLAKSHARQGMSDLAILDLNNLITLFTDADLIDRARYEMGWLHVERGQWDLAQRSFSQISPANQMHFRVNELNQALARSDDIDTKNPTTAGWLSIVPGGGQLYCGRYQDALTAFLVNTGLILAAWEAFDNDLVALGGVISFVEFGFYSGNIYGAVSSARKYNRDQYDAFRKYLNRRRRPSLSLMPSPAGVALCLSLDF
jgi:tetratricopeptide (TPR) repeat protein